MRAFRELCPRGVLRLGGNLSDVTLWKGSAVNTIAPQEAGNVRGFYEWRLVTLDAKDGTQFAQASMDERLVPAYSALFWEAAAGASMTVKDARPRFRPRFFIDGGDIL